MRRTTPLILAISGLLALLVLVAMPAAGERTWNYYISGPFVLTKITNGKYEPVTMTGTLFNGTLDTLTTTPNYLFTVHEESATLFNFQQVAGLGSVEMQGTLPTGGVLSSFFSSADMMAALVFTESGWVIEKFNLTEFLEKGNISTWVYIDAESGTLVIHTNEPVDLEDIVRELLHQLFPNASGECIDAMIKAYADNLKQVQTAVDMATDGSGKFTEQTFWLWLLGPAMQAYITTDAETGDDLLLVRVWEPGADNVPAQCVRTYFPGWESDLNAHADPVTLTIAFLNGRMDLVLFDVLTFDADRRFNGDASDNHLGCYAYNLTQGDWIHRFGSEKYPLPANLFMWISPGSGMGPIGSGLAFGATILGNKHIVAGNIIFIPDEELSKLNGNGKQ